MSDLSSTELERDAELARAQVADTAESLRNKMSPGQLIDEFTGLFKGSDGTAALSNLKNQIRDNPLPLTLVGTGLAWLMLGNPSAGPSRSSGNYPSGRGNWDRASSEGSDMGDLLGPDKNTAAGLMDSASTMAADAVDGAKETAEELLHSVASTGKDWKGQASALANGGRQTVEDLIQREPLIVAAVGVALGAAIGALLPTSHFEDEQLGTYRTKLRDTVDDVYRKGVDEVKEVAAETYATVKAEADKVVGEGDATITERLGNVLKSTAEQTEQVVRDKLKGTMDR